jgi:hypothetical protein
MNGLRQGQASRPQVEAKCAMEVPRWMNMAESVANLLSLAPARTLVDSGSGGVYDGGLPSVL